MLGVKESLGGKLGAIDGKIGPSDYGLVNV